LLIRGGKGALPQDPGEVENSALLLKKGGDGGLPITCHIFKEKKRETRRFYVGPRAKEGGKEGSGGRILKNGMGRATRKEALITNISHA